GPDRNLWFTATYGNTAEVQRITPAGKISTGYQTGGVSQGMTAGPDGNLWLTEQSSAIAKVTTGGQVIRYVCNPTCSPQDITAGPDGNLWFADTSGKIGKVTTSGTITEFPLPLTSASGNGAFGIAVGPDKNLWVTRPNKNSVVKWSPTSGLLAEYILPVP